MNAPLMEDCHGRFVVDPAPDGEISLIAVDDDLESRVYFLTPAKAALLGHRLIAVAAQVESPT